MSSNPDQKETTESTDRRIQCTNNHSLGAILEISMDHVAKFADKQKLEDPKEFLDRFKQIFSNMIQDNVIVNGLPYSVNESQLTEYQRIQQNDNINHSLLSDLCSMIVTTTRKRSTCPQQCRNLYKKRTRRDIQHLKDLPIQHNITIPSASDLDASISSLELIEPEVLEGVCKNMSSTIEEVKGQMDKLSNLNKNISVANNIIKRERHLLETLHDTGYNSS